MQPVSLREIEAFVEANIPAFHQNRIDKLKRLKLKTILKRKNPYLFKVKNITTAGDFIKTILDAYLSSQEETLFGGFLEELARFICHSVYGGQKSAAEGIDLELVKDNIRYIITIKSGPSWGNSSQISRMKDNFRKAKRILKTNILTPQHIIAINGCCYGQDVPTRGIPQAVRAAFLGLYFWKQRSLHGHNRTARPQGQGEERAVSERIRKNHQYLHLGISAGFLQPKR